MLFSSQFLVINQVIKLSNLFVKKLRRYRTNFITHSALGERLGVTLPNTQHPIIPLCFISASELQIPNSGGPKIPTTLAQNSQKTQISAAYSTTVKKGH